VPSGLLESAAVKAAEAFAGGTSQKTKLEERHLPNLSGYSGPKGIKSAERQGVFPTAVVLRLPPNIRKEGGAAPGRDSYECLTLVTGGVGLKGSVLDQSDGGHRGARR